MGDYFRLVSCNDSGIKCDSEGGLLCPLCKGKGRIQDYNCSEGPKRKSAKNGKGGVRWSVIEIKRR
jgi:hypothetical protein